MAPDRVRSLVVLCALVPAQDPAPARPSGPSRVTRGNVVSDRELVAVGAARIEPKGFGIDGRIVRGDDEGSFEVPAGPRCSQSGATSNTGIDFLRISAAGFGSALVDPCAQSPWANPIRLRPASSLVGRFEGAQPGCWVNVVGQYSDVSWPPQSGLTAPDLSWRGLTDAEGRFRIDGLPSQVPLTVVLDPELVRDSPGIDRTVVLQPDREHELDLAGDRRSEGAIGQGTEDGPWVAVDPIARGYDGSLRTTAWFEFVGAGRNRAHPVAGGRWHVHQFRACHHLEIRPGRWVLVARDADGWIGTSIVEVGGSEAAIQPRVELGPGSLIRIDGSRLTQDEPLSLLSGDVEFWRVAFQAGSLRYVVVPAGKIRLERPRKDGDARTIDLDASAGAVVDVTL